MVTGLLINLRLVLLGAALTLHLGRVPAPLRLMVAQFLTDESFAVSMAEFQQQGANTAYHVGSGLTIYAVWQLATLLGVLFGTRMPPGLGLEYALPASLIALLFLLVRDRRAACVALGAAAAALVIRPLVTGTWSTLAATLAAATVGALLWPDPP